MSLIITGFILIALAGAPLFAIFGGLAVALFTRDGIDPAAAIIEFNRLASQPILIAIPLFTFAGYLLARSNAPNRLIRLSRAWIGWIPGGLALVTLLACAVFTAFTGASGVTIIAIGGLVYPILLQEKYPQRFSLGLVASSGSIGLLFPPSLPVILYGIVAKTSVDRLYVGGMLPGIMMILFLAFYSVKVAMPLERIKFDWGNAIASLKEAKWDLPLPFIILFGIYTGKFTVAEAAAITAGYVLIVEVFIHREVSLTKQLPKIMRDSMILVGGIKIILGCALAFTSYLIDAQVPNRLFEWISTFIASKYVFLLLLNVFLLLVGTMMDIFSAIVVVVPLIVPIANQFGVNPIHLGIIFLTNLEIGYLSPPVGMNLFMASYRFKIPLMRLYRVALPFLILMFIALLLITYVPELSLGPVDFFFPKDVPVTTP